MILFSIGILIFTLQWDSISASSTHPEQIHLSLGVSSTEMMITWVTMDQPKHSIVKYFESPNGTIQQINAMVTHFKDSDKSNMYIHRAKLINLLPGHTYKYSCGCDNNWSVEYQFTTISTKPDFSPRLAVYGDLGYENGHSIPQLKDDVRRGLYDAILHIGDIAYNLNKDDGKIGNLFMNAIEPIAANVPYQVCPGNHEEKRNFTHYDNRFTMIDSHSGKMNNHYYSFDIGPAHFVSFSTELYYWKEYYNENHRKWQYEWIENDLKEASKPENRMKRPWIITLGHRPMYCAKPNDDECSHSESIVRKGKSGKDLTKHTSYGLEELFYNHGVDIEFWGHEHHWERLYPVYDRHVFNGSANEPYHNPKAPIHIITGSAGHESSHHVVVNHEIWSAKIIEDYGFTRMHIFNSTHLSIEQISVEKGGNAVDKLMVIKDHHGKYN